MSWKNESRRHALASKGVKTGVKSKPFMKVPLKKQKSVYVMEFSDGGVSLFETKKLAIEFAKSQGYTERSIGWFYPKGESSGDNYLHVGKQIIRN